MLSLSFAAEEAETPLDREARAQAAQFYRRYLTKCDADYFYFTVERAKSPPVVEEWILYQFHGLNIVVSPSTLSEAERLNGLEWRGSGSVFTEAFRLYDVTRQTWRPDRQGRVWGGSMQVTPLEIMLK
jgi:hypothetical protein